MHHLLFQALADAADQGQPVALGVITGVKGSSPQKIGAKALFFSDGHIQGTLGGGCLEAEIQHRAMESLRTGEPSTFELVLDHDFGWDDGLICGGKVMGVIVPRAERAGAAFWRQLAARESTHVWQIDRHFRIGLKSAGDAEGTLYSETVTPPCALWIAGAGHIAQAVAPLAVQLDFQVSIFDDRPALANHALFPEAVVLHVGLWEELSSTPMPDRPAFGLIVTRGHRHDALVLRDWIRKPFQFLGMIGSSRKWRTIAEHFVEEGIASPEELARVACPVGIPIWSESVAEIAVSIMAQFVERRAALVRGRID